MIKMKLFFTDLDGTLLNHSHHTDSHILDGMEAVRQNGCLVIPTTGRPLPLIEEFHFSKGPFVCSNGALLVDENGEIFHTTSISKEVIETLLDTFPEIPFEFCVKDRSLSTFEPERLKREYDERWLARSIHKTPEEIDAHVNRFQTSCSKDFILSQEILKINLTRKDDPDFIRFGEWLKTYPFLQDSPSDGALYELTNPEATKANGIRTMMKHYGVPAENVHVFGDGLNDVSMLEAFENSYSPDNGHPQAKKTAAHLLDSRNEYCVIDIILDLAA